MDDEDYRKILARRFAEMKRRNPQSVSFQTCAARLGISKSYLMNVLNCRRHLAFDNVPVFCRVFGIEDRVAFLLLLCRSLSQNEEVVADFNSLLLKIREGL